MREITKHTQERQTTKDRQNKHTEQKTERQTERRTEIK